MSLAGMILLATPIECRMDAISAMTQFEDAYRAAITEDQADLRFVPLGSERAMTYVDPRSRRMITMVNVSRMTSDCPTTIQLMARHEACHVIHDTDRLHQERPLGAEERMRMEIRAGMCSLAKAK